MTIRIVCTLLLSIVAWGILTAQSTQLCYEEEPYEHFIPFKKNDKWGFVDIDNNVVYPAVLDTAVLETAGGGVNRGNIVRAQALYQGKKTGLISKDFLLKPKVQVIRWLRGVEMFSVTNKKGKQALFSDRTGRFLTEFKYDTIGLVNNYSIILQSNGQQELVEITKEQQIKQVLPGVFNKIFHSFGKNGLVGERNGYFEQYDFDRKTRKVSLIVKRVEKPTFRQGYETPHYGEDVRSGIGPEEEIYISMDGFNDLDEEKGLVYFYDDSTREKYTKAGYILNDPGLNRRINKMEKVGYKPALGKYSIAGEIDERLSFAFIKSYRRDRLFVFPDSLSLISIPSLRYVLVKSPTVYIMYQLGDGGKLVERFRFSANSRILNPETPVLANLAGVFYELAGTHYFTYYNSTRNSPTYRLCSPVVEIIPNLDNYYSGALIRYKGQQNYALVYGFYSTLWITNPFIKPGEYYQPLRVGGNFNPRSRLRSPETMVLIEKDMSGKLLGYRRADGVRFGNYRGL